MGMLAVKLGRGVVELVLCYTADGYWRCWGYWYSGWGSTDGEAGG